MSAPTRSEILVLDALAHELRGLVPDLGQQAARAVVDRRDNTGSGVFTQFRLDRRKTDGADGATGLYGTVHGDWPGFANPVAFQAILSDGRLQGLQATTYDESTLGLNVEAAPVANLFRIDASGRSVPVTPRRAEPAARTAVPSARTAPAQASTAAPPTLSVPVTPARTQPVRSATTAVPPAAPSPFAEAPETKHAPVAALVGGGLMIALVLYLLFNVFGLILFGFFAAQIWGRRQNRERIMQALSAKTARTG